LGELVCQGGHVAFHPTQSGVQGTGAFIGVGKFD
jgi:hypothetical protein